jgi:hypothetical protein
MDIETEEYGLLKTIAESEDVGLSIEAIPRLSRSCWNL